MKRKITAKLYEWKNMKKGRMPLLIYGARQVGKTFEMREFGALYYKNTVYVNFETDERIGKYFDTDIHADYIIAILEKYYQVKIVPENTLIIFDEIQMCERALTSLKYFSEETPEYHVIAAGSLLGVAVNREKYSFPVGKVQMVTMYPMDLEEVLWAKGKQMLSDTIREHYENNQPLDEILHEEALQEFYHYCIVGGMPAAVKADLAKEDLESLKKGIVNLEKHIENLQKFGVPVVVTLNSFVTDTKEEIAFVENFCKERNCEFALSEVWEKGGEGGIELAQKVIATIENKESNFHYLYENDLSIVEKIETIAKEIYGAGEVIIEPAVKQQIARIESLGFGSMPVCMAKNQYSLSDDKTILGRPEGFPIHIRDVYVSAGAGFVVAITGTIMTMPGLPKVPAAEGIDVNDDGQITGLF